MGAVEVHHLARGASDRLADGFGLKERPEVGSLDVVAERVRLRALGHCRDNGQKQRQHRDEQRNPLVVALHLDVTVTMCSGHAFPLHFGDRSPAVRYRKLWGRGTPHFSCRCPTTRTEKGRVSANTTGSLLA